MEQIKRCDVKSLRVGDKLSETQYYTVLDYNNSNVRVINERGMQFSISNNIIEEGIFSANQHTTKVVKVTRTELIEIFKHVGDTVFTVSFNKLPTAEDVNKAIESLNAGKIVSITDMKKTVKSVFKGEERILTGYLIATETGFGRSMVIDLELERGDNPNWDARIRQVDHRSISWLIWKNTRYEVK